MDQEGGCKLDTPAFALSYTQSRTVSIAQPEEVVKEKAK